MRRLKKKIFFGTFVTTVALLGTLRGVFPKIAGKIAGAELDTVSVDSMVDSRNDSTVASVLQNASVRRRYHRIRGVHSYEDCFPDVQDVQIVAAREWGVSPISNRQEAEERKGELVYVGMCPYYDIDAGMNRSIPYLVPRASLLLRHIGRTFMDSLDMKGIPLHRIIVSSLLRTEEDVSHLRRHNGNASEQSCHRFGTTFDIAYNRYNPVYNPDGPKRRSVRDDTLKWVLSEVLRDCRNEGRCYVKHERKQGCFHITVR